MARLFDAYLIADWTAAEGRKLGDNSVWLGVAKRDVRFRLYAETHNVATRAEGEAMIHALLADHRRRGDRVLVGFDFSLGYPRGTAARLGLSETPAWTATGRFLSANVVDKPDNTNNRYQVAAKMNRLMTDQAHPFWGAPAKQTQRWLTATKPPQGSGSDIPEFRRTEDAARKGRLQPKSNWQMHGAGAVGGQTLVGIPMVRRLMEHLGDQAVLWPFQTGWRALEPHDVAEHPVVLAEVWPSMWPTTPAPGEFKDQAQVRTTALALAEMDDKGTLAPAFAPPTTTDPDHIAQVENEEGWILGA